MKKIIDWLKQQIEDRRKTREARKFVKRVVPNFLISTVKILPLKYERVPINTCMRNIQGEEQKDNMFFSVAKAEQIIYNKKHRTKQDYLICKEKEEEIRKGLNKYPIGLHNGNYIILIDGNHTAIAARHINKSIKAMIFFGRGEKY